MVKIGVHYGSYCKIKTGVSLFWTTLYRMILITSGRSRIVSLDVICYFLIRTVTYATQVIVSRKV